MKYYIQARTSLGFDDAIARVTELLKEEGFGVLTEIDVQATLKKKLDIDYKPYRILGACNPPFAHKALSAEPLIGVLLPCNVIVWDDGDDRVVAAMEPLIMAEIIGKPAVAEIAAQTSERIHRVVGKIGEIGA
jgi:uncharacterized protein (DUF302 family)